MVEVGEITCTLDEIELQRKYKVGKCETKKKNGLVLRIVGDELPG